MTLPLLLGYVAIAAVILTLIVVFAFKSHKNIVMTFVQNYVGALFVFSGWVKAVDPLGTAYKMKDYFAEFEATFQATWFSFLAPLFPLLSKQVVLFALVMVIFEIVLGLMLILGHKPKFTAWAFMILVLFFTFLTGFTYLTGYVPNGVNFFEFGKWTAFDENNMKVTDCGCFGDFLKLKPKTSFLKDVFLLFPAIYFIIRSRDMHILFGRNARNIFLSLITIGLLFYCLNNYYWNLPHADFRPFKVGRNIQEAKAIEDAAQADVKVLAYKLTNKSTGKVTELPYEQFLKEFKNYPKEEYEYEQIVSKPTIEKTKLSDFHITDLEGNNINDIILNNEKPVVLILAYKMFGDGLPSTKVVQDTIYTLDTIYDDNQNMRVEKQVQRIEESTVNYIDYLWKDYYTRRFTDVVIPFAQAAEKDGSEVVMVIGQSSKDQIEDFAKDLDFYPVYGMADDLLIKTMIRSNPGVMLWKNGVILDKWHFKKLPTYQVVKEKYLK